MWSGEGDKAVIDIVGQLPHRGKNASDRKTNAGS